jgi:outer membrane protein TolC
MKKKVFLGLMAIAVSLAAGVPLSRAVANAWKISPGLNSQQLEEEAAATAVLTALRQKNFSIFFNGSYRYTSDKVQVTLADFPFPINPSAPPGTVVLSAPNDSVDLKLSLVQPVYSGGILSNAARAETIRAAAERDLTRLKKIELAGKVKSSFFSHRLYCRKRDSLNLLLDILRLHQDRLENLFREELVKKSDLLETRAKADEIRLNLADLEQLIRSEALNFSTLCGYEPQEIDEPADSGGVDFAAAWEQFLAGHPLLRSLDERMRIVQIQKKVVAGATLPQVGIFAELHYSRPGQNFFAKEWTTYVVGGVSVSLPVFNWNKGSRDKSLVDIAGRKLANQRADFIRESEKNLRQLFFLKENLERKLALLDGLVANAGEDARLKEKLYEENQIDHNDYLAALTGREKYRADREELLTRMGLLQVGIETLIGKCEEE